MSAEDVTMTAEQLRAAADKACWRADVEIEEWDCDGDAMRIVVSSEFGRHTFGTVGLQRIQSQQEFEDLMYRTVLDWTK